MPCSPSSVVKRRTTCVPNRPSSYGTRATHVSKPSTLVIPYLVLCIMTAIARRPQALVAATFAVAGGCEGEQPMHALLEPFLLLCEGIGLHGRRQGPERRRTKVRLLRPA